MISINETELPEKGGSVFPDPQGGETDSLTNQEDSDSVARNEEPDSIKCEKECKIDIDRDNSKEFQDTNKSQSETECKIDIDQDNSKEFQDTNKSQSETECKIDIDQDNSKELQDTNKSQSENKSPKCEDIPEIQDSNTQQKQKRKWEVFPGGNIFHCNGRIIRAPEYIGYLVSLMLIVITGVLFFGSDCVYLSQKVGPVIPAIGAPIFLMIVILLHRTTFTDPGIIPRASKDEIDQQEPGFVPIDKKLPRYIERTIKGRVFQLSYCTTCHLYRPPRASHCSTCDNCVSRFDNHCPIVSNCIGARNYRYYYLLVISLTLVSCYIIGCNIAVICMRTQELGAKQAFISSIPSLVESLICIGGLASGLVCLSGIHTMLICREQTTHEICRGTFNKKVFVNNLNPYSRGRWYINCLHILCTSPSPSLIDKRGFVDTDILEQPISPV